MNYNIFSFEIPNHSNVFRKIIALVLGFFVVLITSNLSPANQQETTKLMIHASKLSQEGKNQEALKIFLEIARREPENYFAHNNVGMVYSEMKEYKKALKAYEKSLSINPAFSMALNNIGYLHMTIGHYNKAEKYLKRALTYFKSLHLASANLGQLYLLQKRYDEAMKYLKKSLKDMPTLVHPHKLIGEIHQAQGRKKAAQIEFNLYEKLSNKSK